MERPHSRKVKVVEGEAEVKKGEKLDTVMAGSGEAPLAGNEKKEDEKEG
ncbi:MAG: hypothetical protein IJX90_03925 [Blautia sp.]|nr:hypothetical protein [Blautia sp.]